MRKIISISLAIAATASMSYAQANTELQELRQQIQQLEQRQQELEKQRFDQRLSRVEAQAMGDNLKFDVDYRVTMDSLKYKLHSGATQENSSLLANRMILGMNFRPNDSVRFAGKLAYNKAFGDTANHSQSNTDPGYANFDWVVNENPLDNTLKVKEAYFHYATSMGSVPFAASLGRRPSTDGFLAHLREGDSHYQSPLAHSINVEFDGASFTWQLEGLIGLPGSSFKICTGRGLTNANPRFDMMGYDYAKDESLHSNIDMLGFIFQPYSDGQYTVQTQAFKAWNLIGFTGADMMAYQNAVGTFMMDPDPNNLANNYVNMMMAQPSFSDVGDMYGATVSVLANGVGDFNSFLDNTKLFVSYAVSQTLPNDSMSMLGSTDNKTGYSIWMGAEIPGMITRNGRLGFEYNEGSKYWRSFTYGEDTMIGSKLAARGKAYEAYYTQPLVGNTLSMQLRYTYIDYDYTGSNAFFGDDGAPQTIADAAAAGAAMGMDPVDSASDIRLSFRYRF
ncbi:DUF3373 domain-containing protein [Desulfurispirillum indicum]|uniref:DUF3373 domain-containing protein n=1 Tax=Desulfurispirillum indicum (strain ATCC BAA-1389 / DSM 22839 / S5) TaxID=653733 RepID=E6W5I3_DESIS|nr:DUF3373 domain-containing protein [Desulfurispirillum indicum]ADU64914.1 hypothetical protein Selin_0156 [Desulfurispirillum indicum S5]UCZ56845.1 DUF3373 domain-containing protein [Desulfurispirillum indicum]